MSTGTAVLVALAGGLGALLRLLIGRAVTIGSHGPLAAGTFTVNVTGAFALGLVTGLAPSGDDALILGTGLLGGYTTFSTWMYESQRFAREHSGRAAAINIGVSMFAGLFAIWLARALSGA